MKVHVRFLIPAIFFGGGGSNALRIQHGADIGNAFQTLATSFEC